MSELTLMDVLKFKCEQRSKAMEYGIYEEKDWDKLNKYAKKLGITIIVRSHILPQKNIAICQTWVDHLTT